MLNQVTIATNDVQGVHNWLPGLVYVEDDKEGIKKIYFICYMIIIQKWILGYDRELKVEFCIQ